MLTYSINTGTVTESTNLGTLNDILSSISDNAQKAITPRDLRNVAFTLWNNAGLFKTTGVSSSNVEYIGMDYTQTGLQLKQKTFFGKRQVGGLDIMNDDLLNSNTDIFIYNNKSDLVSQDITRMTFLSGSQSSLFTTSPYIESLYVTDVVPYIDFNINNDSGNINITSADKHVNINGLLFPTVLESASASNGYLLKYLNDGTQSYIKLLPSETLETNLIYSSATVSIIGNPITMNGKDVNFSNINPMLITVGGLSSGTTFSNVAVVDLLNSLLYPYVLPTGNMTLNASALADSIFNNNTNNVYAEVGGLITLNYVYNIQKGSNNLASIITSPGGTQPPNLLRLSGTSSISVPGITSSTTIYTIGFTDGTQSAFATSSLTYVYPYFWGLTQGTIDFNIVDAFSQMNKVTKTKSDTTVNLSGDEVRIYFACPSSYGDITQIIDGETGWNFISSFSKIYSGSLTSSSPFWSTNYDVYQYTAGGGITTVNSSWTFKH
jgi:hypothetical protein